MANVLIENSVMQDIASAIRAKDGLSTAMYPSQMAHRISDIPEDNSNRIIEGTLSEITNNTVSSIRRYAFYSCSKLTSINFPVCTNIGDSAFYSCSKLTSINFPVCTNIGADAFRSCSSLISADFPVCTSIGSNAFFNCSSLTTLNLSGVSKVTTLGTSTTISTKISSIIVPMSLVSNFQTHSLWKNFSSKIFGYEE